MNNNSHPNALPERIAELILKQLENTLTAAEKTELDQWLHTSAREQELFSNLTDSAYVQQELGKFYEHDAEEGWQKIQRAYPAGKVRLMPGKYWLAAALLISFIGAGIMFLYTSRQPGQPSQQTFAQVADITAPVTSRATITLPDGRKLPVDSIAAGTVTMQEHTSIRKTEDGRIFYSEANVPNGPTYFHTLTNPRGSKVIQLMLSDGTRAWLNVESEMRYPVAFNSSSREIEITGEVYLEVAPDRAKPFLVKANGVEVQVLGTQFNINAYKDENTVKITLVDGAVKVSQNNNVVMLHPGEQAQAGAVIKVNRNVDMEQVMAWKNGLFSFKDSDIGTIMRQLSKWYDVNVHFNDSISEHFYGEISRDKNISSVLNMLQTTGSVHFKMTGNNIEVKK